MRGRPHAPVLALSARIVQKSLIQGIPILSIPESLDHFLKLVLDEFRRAVPDAKHPFHFPAISTVDANGHPCCRTVILRQWIHDDRMLAFHTDSRSAKIRQLAAFPYVEWLFWNPKRKLQVRAASVATLHSGNDRSRAVWDKLQPGNRRNYCTEPAPDTLVSVPSTGMADALVNSATVENTESGFANFVVVETRVESLDCLILRKEGNYRARFAPSEQSWLIP